MVAGAGEGESMSELEATFENHLHVHGLPPAIREFPGLLPIGRRHKFDFAWVAQKIVVEIEGGTRANGRHNRHEGYTKDCEKYNLATREGWQIYRFTSEMVNDGSAVNFMCEVFQRLGTMEMQF
jgi:very-short-patch-repair endonuclease